MCGHRRYQEGGVRRRSSVPVDDLRASDAERERVVADLRAHAADGRLTVEELEERVDVALAARTHRELARLTEDLPRPPRPDRARAGLREHARTYLMVMLLLVGIWALSGAGYPWFLWPALGWGFGLVLHAGGVRSAARQVRRAAA